MPLLPEDSPLPLGPFIRRVRLARAWRGAALGASGGALLGVGWVVLDATRVVFAEGWHIAALVGAGALVGTAVGYFRKVSDDAIAMSVDRRGRLRDRLTTAREGITGSFADELDADARHSVENLSPRSLYPVKTGKLHAGALALTAMAAGVYILETDPALLRPSLRPKVAEAKKQAAEIERVVAKVLDPKERSSEELKRLALEARRLQKEIERARLKPEEAVERGQKIAEDARKLAEKSAEKSLVATERAEDALQKLQKRMLESKSIPVKDLEQMPTSTEDAQAKVEAAEQALEKTNKEAADAKSKEEALRKALQDTKLTPEQRKAMEQALKEAEQTSKSAMEAADKAAEELKLSKEAQAGLEELMKDPAFKELQKMAEKLRKEMQAAKEGKRPELSKEELKEMQRQAEELGKKLKDAKFREEFLKALKEALESGEESGDALGVGIDLGLGMGLGTAMNPQQGPGGTGPDSDRMTYDTKNVNKSEKPQTGKGKGKASYVPTQRGDGAGRETFVEIKGPTSVGTRSSIPLTKQIPKYQAEAESAIRSQSIPKKHQKRVREYFSGLGGGK